MGQPAALERSISGLRSWDVALRGHGCTGAGPATFGSRDAGARRQVSVRGT